MKDMMHVRGFLFFVFFFFGKALYLFILLLIITRIPARGSLILEKKRNYHPLKGECGMSASPLSANHALD
jgi:hypothetical protein